MKYAFETGFKNPLIKKCLKKYFANSFPMQQLVVDNDLSGAAKALCGDEKEIPVFWEPVQIHIYYNGKKIVKNSPGLGFILGDEGSGAYLGKKVIQHYLYNIFDEDLRARFRC